MDGCRVSDSSYIKLKSQLRCNSLRSQRVGRGRAPAPWALSQPGLPQPRKMARQGARPAGRGRVGAETSGTRTAKSCWWEVGSGWQERPSCVKMHCGQLKAAMHLASKSGLSTRLGSPVPRTADSRPFQKGSKGIASRKPSVTAVGQSSLSCLGSPESPGLFPQAPLW